MRRRLAGVLAAVARAVWRGLVLHGSAMAGVPLDEDRERPEPDRPLTDHERTMWTEIERRIAPPR
ncbi:hypothetical protein AB0F72_34345 [Actinoplanes sp. NPDC023936]|uniref:hypothetical protein n=1 Tax=Actinoplanes sp. NPDC023936 TaxID=3154910 RepID=UPI0033E2A3A5